MLILHNGRVILLFFSVKLLQTGAYDIFHCLQTVLRAPPDGATGACCLTRLHCRVVCSSGSLVPCVPTGRVRVAHLFTNIATAAGYARLAAWVIHVSSHCSLVLVVVLGLFDARYIGEIEHAIFTYIIIRTLHQLELYISPASRSSLPHYISMLAMMTNNKLSPVMLVLGLGLKDKICGLGVGLVIVWPWP